MKLPIPLVSRLMHRLLPGRSFRDAAVRSWEVAPGCVRTTDRAVFEPAALARIEGVAEDSTLALQIARVEGGRIENAPTTAYLLKDAWMCNGHVVLPTCNQRIASGSLPWLADTGAPSLDRAVLGSTRYGVRFFGHWVLDDLPLQLAARALGPVIDVVSERSLHQVEYERRLGLSGNTCLEARIRELVVLDDLGQNDFKAARLEELRRRLVASVEPMEPAAYAGVMVLRKDTGKSRRLVNEMALAKGLSAQGFAIVSPMESTVEDTVKTIAGARVVIGVEGSHLAHALLCMAPGSTLITIQPPTRFDAVLKDWCDCKGVRYGFVVGGLASDGFTADPDQVARILRVVI
jgi:capsular polysaccharide biosynthesis protein